MYRVKQLWWAVTARPLSAENKAQVQSVLSSAEFALFQTVSNNEQQHGVRVLTHLQKRGAQHPSLLKAALLHDLGKARTRPTILDRCLIVLVSKLMPKTATAWGFDLREPFGIRRAFVTRAHHPKWGAERAIAMGSDATTVALIRWHQAALDEAPADLVPLLRDLQWADDQS